jgi:hypothetical protein
MTDLYIRRARRRNFIALAVILGAAVAGFFVGTWLR